MINNTGAKRTVLLVEDFDELAQVEAMPLGEMRGLGEAGHQGDEIEVHRELHRQSRGHFAAEDGVPAHRREERAHPRDGGFAPGEHRGS